MANGDESGLSQPDWIVPGLRCALEIALVLMITVYLGSNVGSTILAGLIIAVGTVGAGLILFWCVKTHVVAWIRYASQLSRRRRKARR